MTARPSLDDAAALISDEAVARLQSRPDFRSVVEDFVAESLAYHLGLDETGRWMQADLGRISTYVATVLLDANPDGASVARLSAASQQHGASSRGRVAQFIRYAQDAGEIAVPPGSEHWTRRRLILRPAFTERLRRRTFIDVRAVARLAPEVASMADKLKDDATYRRFLAWTSVLTNSAPISGPPTPTMLFMRRQMGMQLLHHLMLAQPSDRTRMLEEAPISRNQLSQTYGVSRAHINRLLADAEAQGLLSCPSPTRVVFSPVLSDNYALTRAFLFQISHAAYLTTLATEPLT